MDTQQKIEVLKISATIANTVLTDRNNLAMRTVRVGAGGDIATAVVEHLFKHFCGLVEAKEEAGTGNAN